MSRIKSVIAAAAVAVTIMGGSAALASAASAATASIGVTQNTSGEAGYYVNDNGNWHIRDAHAAFTVTAAMKSTTDESTVNNAVGAELCDPNSGDAAQIGLLWEGPVTGFELAAQTGNLVPTTQDPCIQDGVITSTPDHVLIGGGDGWTIRVGDQVSVDVFYNPATSGRFRSHVIQYTACDVTQDVCRQAFDRVRVENFFEAGIGVLNTDAPLLTAPALNPLVSFTAATFTNYLGTVHGVLQGGWELKEAVTVNGASQPTLQPSAPSGSAFSVAEGSASA